VLEVSKISPTIISYDKLSKVQQNAIDDLAKGLKVFADEQGRILKKGVGKGKGNFYDYELASKT